MTLTRKMTGLGLALAATALMFGAFIASASAQTPPFTAYGTMGDIAPGDTIGWTLAGTICGTTTVDAQNQWLLHVEPTSECPVSEGQTVGFTINGEPANETIVFVPGGAPDDVAEGITLTLADAVEPPVPAPAGNAGLLGGASAGASMALVMLLGIAAAVLVAGARTATRRS